ncbi:uncharacterized protein LOC127437016 isoform X11 [Myxocyprinus asiaticus]|uniref:uncharacterized protein LOC127437016 isoform X11 n=1 Tax=Myxocyprinus asiaticus TaxID=70543 RepID=UPI00222214AB|nr:uncharacterized protein LOC127437016 isoform X11 [Myxocyprinus asiaticus]
MESVLPLSSLRLLVPPLRLTSALMWQVVQDQNVEQFGKLEEFVSVMTNLMPELLSKRQRATLIVGLRAKTGQDCRQANLAPTCSAYTAMHL